MATSFTLTERVCLNTDKSKVVDCNSEEAAFSLGGVGAQIPMAEAEKYGLTKKSAKAEVEDKMAAPTEDKAAPKPKTKRKAK